MQCNQLVVIGRLESKTRALSLDSCGVSFSIIHYQHQHSISTLKQSADQIRVSVDVDVYVNVWCVSEKLENSVNQECKKRDRPWHGIIHSCQLPITQSPNVTDFPVFCPWLQNPLNHKEHTVFHQDPLGWFWNKRKAQKKSKKAEPASRQVLVKTHVRSFINWNPIEHLTSL